MPDCPDVFALADARNLDRFRPGGGHDVTDLDYSARIESWTGSCEYVPRGDDWTVDLDLTITFEIKRGPANTSRHADVQYFVAIPAFYPAHQAKKIYSVHPTFPAGVDTVNPVAGPIHMKIPVRTSDAVNLYTIYLGLQLDEAELQYNRLGR